MREMIGVVKYTCDFCGFTLTKPSSKLSTLPDNWRVITITDPSGNKHRQDCCLSCREKHNV